MFEHFKGINSPAVVEKRVGSAHKQSLESFIVVEVN